MAKLPDNFNQLFAEATAVSRVIDMEFLTPYQIELVRKGARIGWEMASGQEIDLTRKYSEMKEFFGDSNRTSLAGYRLGITDAQSILFEHGIANTKGPIANKPEDFKE